MNNNISKNILVTGGGGYVGSVLVSELAKRHSVSVVDKFWFIKPEDLPFYLNPSIKIHVGDICNRALIASLLAEVDTVIHLAAIANDPCFDLNHELGNYVNIEGTTILAEEAKKAGVKHFIFASSSSVYGPCEDDPPNEQKTIAPITGYSRSKAMAEEILHKFSDASFNVTIVRPATVCGLSPRLRLDVVVNMFTAHAFFNKRVTIFGGHQCRPNIHMADLTSAYLLIAERPTTSFRIFNLGAQNLTLNEIVEKVATTSTLSFNITHTTSTDARSYKIDSSLFANSFQVQPVYKVDDAISELVFLFEKNKEISRKEIKKMSNVSPRHLYKAPHKSR